MDDTLRFLSTIFGNLDGLYLNLWHKESKHSHWFNDHELAHKFITSETGVNYYISIGLMPQDMGHARRMTKESVHAIVGLYVDVDIAGLGHDKANLPTDEASAIQIIHDFPLRPTLVVHSGGGFQGWWALKEPLVFATPQERDEAAKVSWRFNYTFKQKYNHGFTLDSIFNLDRLGRLPGTINRKPGRDDRVAKIVEYSGSQYNLGDIEQYCLAADQITRETPTAAVSTSEGFTLVRDGNLILDPNVPDPSIDLYQILCDSFPRFQETWQAKREFKSASEYDYSIASVASNLGMADQDIVNLIIAWHRKHQGKLIGTSENPVSLEKCLKPQYIGITLAKLRQSEKKTTNYEVPDTVSKAWTTVECDHNDGDSIQQEIDELSKYFQFKIKAFRAVKGDRVIYEIDTDVYGKIELGTADVLQTQRSFMSRLIDAGIKKLPDIPKGRWPKILNTLLAIRQDVTMSEDATELGQVKDFLAEYLQVQTVIDKSQVTSNCEPFIDSDGIWHIRNNDFVTHIRSTYGIKYQPMDMCKLFERLGIHRKEIELKIKERRANRSYYPIPKEALGTTSQPPKMRFDVIDGGKAKTNADCN